MKDMVGSLLEIQQGKPRRRNGMSLFCNKWNRLKIRENRKTIAQRKYRSGDQPFSRSENAKNSRKGDRPSHSGNIDQGIRRAGDRIFRIRRSHLFACSDAQML